jgi:predicted amidophosphoribosyltransferase
MANKADSSLFINLGEHNITIILVYIDDIIITGNNLDEIKRVKKNN